MLSDHRRSIGPLPTWGTRTSALSTLTRGSIYDLCSFSDSGSAVVLRPEKRSMCHNPIDVARGGPSGGDAVRVLQRPQECRGRAEADLPSRRRRRGADRAGGVQGIGVGPQEPRHRRHHRNPRRQAPKRQSGRLEAVRPPASCPGMPRYSKSPPMLPDIITSRNRSL
jgi:hypothetical protein